MAMQSRTLLMLLFKVTQLLSSWAEVQDLQAPSPISSLFATIRRSYLAVVEDLCFEHLRSSLVANAVGVFRRKFGTQGCSDLLSRHHHGRRRWRHPLLRGSFLAPSEDVAGWGYVRVRRMSSRWR